MTGYQEVLTDPSYRGQIVAMTYPLIGNYGTNSIDQESRSPHVRGFIIEELTEVPSNWRSEMSLDEYLRKWKIPGAQGIDTRALTRHLRTRGAMKACLTTERISPEEAARRALEGEGVIGMDYVREVSTSEIYRWIRRCAKRTLVDYVLTTAEANAHFRRSDFASQPTIMESKKIYCARCARKASRRHRRPRIRHR
jgi:carbamoyl-phosphate synthase small subunit